MIKDTEGLIGAWRRTWSLPAVPNPWIRQRFGSGFPFPTLVVVMIIMTPQQIFRRWSQTLDL